MATQSTFGKYKLIAELGHGGMADVFLAVASGPEGLGFSKLVVVKKLRPNLAEDPEFVAMLVDEARIAARLNHPNAVQTYEIGEVNGQYFISMEYLNGQPLSRIGTRSAKQNKPLPMAHWLSIYADVLAGLHHAHELGDYDGSPLGVVHRDVTPHNIFVTYDGQVKIVDFGIAKAAGRASQTQHGVVKGKVVYMSPEQASAQDVDRRTDLFAVGIMMWETLTGERLWKGCDELTVMSRLIARDLPGSPITVKPDVDPELDRICKRALEARPEDRYQTAEEMGNEITDYLRDKGTRPTTREIGQNIGELFADRRKMAREVIEAQLADLKKKGGALSVRSLPGAPTSDPNAVASARDRAPSSVAVVELKEPDDPTSTPDVDPDTATRLGGKTPTGTRTGTRTGTGTGTEVPSSSDSGRRTTGSTKTSSTRSVATGKRTKAPSSKERSASRGMLIGAGIVIAAVATVEVVALRKDPPPPAGEVTVSLTSDAPGTMFRVDDRAPIGGPFTGRFPKDDAIHVVTASAPNCEPARHELRFSGDASWVARMKCVGSPSPSTSGAPAPSSREKP